MKTDNRKKEHKQHPCPHTVHKPKKSRCRTEERKARRDEGYIAAHEYQGKNRRKKK